MVKTMTLKLTVVLSMKLTVELMSTIISHINWFKYKNVMFNIKNVTTINSYTYLVKDM